MTIDIHTHLGSTRMESDDVSDHTLKNHVNELIRHMDMHGIEKAVVCPTAPNYDNDLHVAAASMNPDRLMSACAIIPRPLSNARKTVTRYADEGCKAVIFDDRLYHPQDPAAYALLQASIEADLAIYLHNAEMTSDTITFLDRASQMYPDGRFVVLHMGSLFGFPKLLPLVARSNIWLEVSVTLIKLVESPLKVFLDALVQDIGVRRLVFGSEHYTEYGDLRAVLNMIDLNVETSQIITKGNAKDILRL